MAENCSNVGTFAASLGEAFIPHGNYSTKEAELVTINCFYEMSVVSSGSTLQTVPL